MACRASDRQINDRVATVEAHTGRLAGLAKISREATVKQGRTENKMKSILQKESSTTRTDTSLR
jgi:hypothetical protein